MTVTVGFVFGSRWAWGARAAVVGTTDDGDGGSAVLPSGCKR